jgi:hypothetical protein
VGTGGGKGHYPILEPIANSEVHNDETYGVRAEANPQPRELRVAIRTRGGRDLQPLRQRPLPLSAAQTSRTRGLLDQTARTSESRSVGELAGSFTHNTYNGLANIKHSLTLNNNDHKDILRTTKYYAHKQV